MSTFLAHSVSAAALTAANPDPLVRRWSLLVAAVLCAGAPDLDVIGFHLGVPYEHVFGHRGFSHSLTFAAFLAAACSALISVGSTKAKGGRLRLFVFLFLVTASHGLIDAMTNGGLGIAFFAPFDNTRYFLPWRPLVVPPIGITRMFSPWGLEVLRTEALYIGLPGLAVIAGRSVVGRLRSRG